MKKIIILILFAFNLSAQSPNIIFIMADDMGYAEISRNGTKYDTPEIDTMATNGAYFSQFYVSPGCTPTRCAFMSGQYPFKVDNEIGVIWQWEDRRLADSVNILPRLMKEQGYTTGIIGKWHVGHAYPEMLPQANNWDYSFSNYMGTVDDWYTYNGLGAYDLHENGHRFDTTGYLTEVQGAKAVQYINQNARCVNQPFFLYIAFQAPHIPLQAPADRIAEAPGSLNSTEKTRWAMIKIMDEQIGRIKDAIEANGIDSNTVIIFTSDNGAPGLPSQPDVGGDNSPWSGTKSLMREGGVRVPFVWYYPGTTAAGTIVDSACHIVDLVPTFVRGVASGSIGTTESANLDGYNFYNLVGGSSGDLPADRKILLGMSDTSRWAVVQGRWKLHNNIDQARLGETFSRSLTFYDLLSDTTESVNILDSFPIKVAELLDFAESFYPQLREQEYTGSQPGGFSYPDIWGDPKTFYNPNYQFYREP